MRIFIKQLLLYLGILVISLIFLGLVLAQGINSYLTNQRIASLTDSAQRVSGTMESSFIRLYMHLDFNLDPLVTEIERLNDLLGANVSYVTADFEEITLGVAEGLNLPIEYLASIMEGETVVISGFLCPQTGESLLIAGHPVILAGNVIGAVLVSVSMAELESTISGMYRITFLSLFVAALLGSILIYMSSQAITRPLRQMNKAAEIIAGGVFEKRIPVHTKDEVGQLATQFNVMAESLYTQEKIRRAFIANMSHDIRSPLTSMLGFITAIKDGTAPIEKHDYYMDIVHDETERLIKLSNTLLDIHHIQDAKLELTKSVFDINELIRKNILGFERRVVQKQISIVSHFARAAHMVIADEEKIQRCMYNLLDNAVKFTPTGGEITVETTAKGKKVEISVTDNGLGMTPEEQKYIFDRFFKNDPSRNEDKMGHGLGLSIVREFINAHDEIITVESTPKKGSTFAFTLTVYENQFL